MKFCGQEIVKVNVSHEEADYPTLFFLYVDKYKLDKVNCANSSLYCWGVLGGNLLVDNFGWKLLSGKVLVENFGGNSMLLKNRKKVKINHIFEGRPDGLK